MPNLFVIGFDQPHKAEEACLKLEELQGKYVLDIQGTGIAASSNVNNDRGLGHVGGGVEYRFTPHIGIFGEAGYDWVGGGQHNFNSSVKNFIQANFGFRFAF